MREREIEKKEINSYCDFLSSFIHLKLILISYVQHLSMVYNLLPCICFVDFNVSLCFLFCFCQKNIVYNCMYCECLVIGVVTFMYIPWQWVPNVLLDINTFLL